MKIAFHFIADHPSLGNFYGIPIVKKVFSSIQNQRTLNISSKVFIGDLLLHNLAYEKTKAEAGAINYVFNKELFLIVFQNWIEPENVIWKRMNPKKLEEVVKCRVFTLCFENIDLQESEYLDKSLESFEPYVGALEVDDSSYVHWKVYSNSLIPFIRLSNKNINIFWDGFEEEEKDAMWFEVFEDTGFKVDYESLEGRYTIFDKYHNFDHARRVAEWKKICGGILAFIADDVVNKFIDIAPDLGNKLWSAINTYNKAETNEQFAQVNASCRRIIEYITDSIFPPIDGTHKGHKLGKQEYKNRLLAYADNERKSDTDIDLILVSTESLNDQIEKLLKLVNKGVHAEAYQYETRRCVLRTILLLDDILSLKKQAFPIKTEFDIELIMELVKKEYDRLRGNS